MLLFLNEHDKKYKIMKGVGGWCYLCLAVKYYFGKEID